MLLRLDPNLDADIAGRVRTFMKCRDMYFCSFFLRVILILEAISVIAYDLGAVLTCLSQITWQKTFVFLVIGRYLPLLSWKRNGCRALYQPSAPSAALAVPVRLGLTNATRNASIECSNHEISIGTNCHFCRGMYADDFDELLKYVF